MEPRSTGWCYRPKMPVCRQNVSTIRRVEAELKPLSTVILHIIGSFLKQQTTTNYLTVHTPSIEFPAACPQVRVISLDLSAAPWVCLPRGASCDCTASTASDIYEYTEKNQS